MRVKKEVFSFLAALVLFLILFQETGYLLLPELDVSGTDWKSYRKEPENSIQVMFVGSSVVFCDIVPAVIFEESGITSYMIAGPEQTIPISYYYIREACKTQKPEVVCVELKGLFFSQYAEHTIANLAFMPRGLNRLEAVFKTAREEDISGLLFPVLNYHDRWNDLTVEEVKKRLKPAQISMNAGYMQQDYFQAQGPVKTYHPGEEYTETCILYLHKIAEYCHDNDIKLYLFLAPMVTTFDQETKNKISLLAEGLNVNYYDFSNEEAFQKIGLDKNTDWFDDIHLNSSGARCFSVFLASLLKNEGIRPNNQADESIWNKRIKDFYGE